MKKNDVTMVHPQKIVNKGFKGCKSSRTVTTFAQKHGVPCVWWKPTPRTKILLVDLTCFRQTWNQFNVQKSTTVHSVGRTTSKYNTGSSRSNKGTTKSTTRSSKISFRPTTYGKKTGWSTYSLKPKKTRRSY